MNASYRILAVFILLLSGATFSDSITIGASVTPSNTVTLTGKTLGSLSFTASNPAISSCGTSPSVDANSSNYAGKVTVGSVAAASCTVTFAAAFNTYNHCRITSQSTIASFAYSYTLSAITVTGTSLVGDLFDYECDGV